jgi:hypothetical protein
LAHFATCTPAAERSSNNRDQCRQSAWQRRCSGGAVAVAMVAVAACWRCSGGAVAVEWWCSGGAVAVDWWCSGGGGSSRRGKVCRGRWDDAHFPSRFLHSACLQLTYIWGAKATVIPSQVACCEPHHQFSHTLRTTEVGKRANEHKRRTPLGPVPAWYGASAAWHHA